MKYRQFWFLWWFQFVNSFHVVVHPKASPSLLNSSVWWKCIIYNFILKTSNPSLSQWIYTLSMYGTMSVAFYILFSLFSYVVYLIFVYFYKFNLNVKCLFILWIYISETIWYESSKIANFVQTLIVLSTEKAWIIINCNGIDQK